MNDKNIFDALRNIDEEWILDAAPQNRRHVLQNWVKWGSLAACFCLIVAATVGITLWLQPDVPNLPNSDSQPEEILPHTHLFGEWQVTREATCSVMGIETRLCSCGEQETKNVALLPHFAGAWVVEKEPTIKLPTPEDPTEREPGIKAQFCEHCGAKLDEELIPATGSLGLAYAINPDGKTFSVAGIGNCVDEHIIVPENFCGYHVTSIVAGAFEDCEALKSITFPRTVTVISERAFRWCKNLEEVILPDTLTEIGVQAFYNCDALKGIHIPQSVTQIGESAFDSCYDLKSVILPKGIVALEAKVFNYCYNLESIILPDGLKSIGESAFSSCRRLKNITIPSGVTSIGEYAFFNCSSLESIVLPDGLETIQAVSFSYCTKLVNVTLPQGLKSIGRNAFSQCSTLKSIDIPDGVTLIDSFAFSQCWKLESVKLSQKLETLERGVFSGCNNLYRVNISNSVTFIGSSAFSDCKNLSELTIPESVTHIGSNAFENCEMLLQVENGVSYVGKWAVDFEKDSEEVVLRSDTVGLCEDLFFASTTLLKVTLPNSLQYICNEALAYGWELREIVFEGTPKEWDAIQKADDWDYNSNLYELIFMSKSGE